MMTRVAVIGNAGGGKSTLCRQLGKAKQLPLYSVDKIQWNPDLTPRAKEDVTSELDELASEARWIIDGWGSWESIEKRFAAADTIIFIDLPLRIHYWWSLKRQFKTIFTPRKDLPQFHPTFANTKLLFKIIAHVHEKMRPRLLALIQKHQSDSGKQIFVLRSPKELRQFITIQRVS